MSSYLLHVNINPRVTNVTQRTMVELGGGFFHLPHILQPYQVQTIHCFPPYKTSCLASYCIECYILKVFESKYH